MDARDERGRKLVDTFHRALNDVWRNEHKDPKRTIAMSASNRDLHAHLDTQATRIATLEAENERLRDALNGVLSVADRDTDLFRRARRALSPQETDDE